MFACYKVILFRLVALLRYVICVCGSRPCPGVGNSKREKGKGLAPLIVWKPHPSNLSTGNLLPVTTWFSLPPFIPDPNDSRLLGKRLVVNPSYGDCTSEPRHQVNLLTGHCTSYHSCVMFLCSVCIFTGTLLVLCLISRLGLVLTHGVGQSQTFKLYHFTANIYRDADFAYNRRFPSYMSFFAYKCFVEFFFCFFNLRLELMHLQVKLFAYNLNFLLAMGLCVGQARHLNPLTSQKLAEKQPKTSRKTAKNFSLCMLFKRERLGKGEGVSHRTGHTETPKTP